MAECVCELPERQRRTERGWRLRCPVHEPPFGIVGSWDEPQGSPPGGWYAARTEAEPTM